MPNLVRIQTEIEVYTELTELNLQEQTLLKAAQNACDKAYAPYSNFHVGAAVLLKNGNIIEGVNQENAAYPSGLCAERVAFFNSGVLFPNEEILQVAIAARKSNLLEFVAATPCGACRQVMAEFEDRQNHPISVIFRTESQKIVKVKSISDLLPLKFDSKSLQ
jgi:cytidine deaminase